MSQQSLLKEKHIKYIQTLDDHTDSLAYWLTEHLRLSEYLPALVATPHYLTQTVSTGVSMLSI